MRILHVTGTLDPNAGGPPAVVGRLSAATAALGHEVTVLSHGDQEVQSRAAEAFRNVPGLDRVNFRWLPAPTRWESFTASTARRSFAEAGRFDVVHLHGVWERILPVSAAMARAQRTPYVVRPCGMLDPWALAQSAWKKRLALALGYRRMLDSAAFLHVLNDDEGRLIEPLGLAAPRITIPNGVFLEELDPLPPRGTFRKQHPKLGDCPIVLFLSRLHYKKGLDILAQSFKIVADVMRHVQLVVAGPDDGARGDFEKQVSDLALQDRVHLVGPLYGAEKVACLVDADCFCLPSRQEGFSVAITEALACRLPVVITSACHFPEVAKAGAGHVVGLDAAAIARALIEVLESPARAERMGQAARALVESRYTWPAVAQQCIDAYSKFVST